jgi:hypothetical protein
MIIGLSGYAKSGKDTVADIILKYESSFQIKKFSAKLKLIASILTGIPVEDFEKQEVKDGYLPDVWNRDNVFFEPHGSAIGDLLHMVITRDRKYQVREFLQELGTEIRDRIHPDAWVNGLMADYGLSTTWVDAKEELFFPNWVISDVRFENEAQAIKDRGGYIIRINRPNTSPYEEGIDFHVIPANVYRATCTHCCHVGEHPGQVPGSILFQGRSEACIIRQSVRPLV